MRHFQHLSGLCEHAPHGNGIISLSCTVIVTLCEATAPRSGDVVVEGKSERRRLFAVKCTRTLPGLMCNVLYAVGRTGGDATAARWGLGTGVPGAYSFQSSQLLLCFAAALAAASILARASAAFSFSFFEAASSFLSAFWNEFFSS